MFHKVFRDTDSFQLTLQCPLWALRLAVRERELSTQQEAERDSDWQRKHRARPLLLRAVSPTFAQRICMYSTAQNLVVSCRNTEKYNIYSGFFLTQLQTYYLEAGKTRYQGTAAWLFTSVKINGVESFARKKTNTLHRYYPQITRTWAIKKLFLAPFYIF